MAAERFGPKIAFSVQLWLEGRVGNGIPKWERRENGDYVRRFLPLERRRTQQIRA
jgi:hypothetical protein